jgi:hypothetical protein
MTSDQSQRRRAEALRRQLRQTLQRTRDILAHCDRRREADAARSVSPANGDEEGTALTDPTPPVRGEGSHSAITLVPGRRPLRATGCDDT